MQIEFDCYRCGIEFEDKESIRQSRSKNSIPDEQCFDLQRQTVSLINLAINFFIMGCK